MVAEPGSTGSGGEVRNGTDTPVPEGNPLELGGEVSEGIRRSKRRFSPAQAQAQAQSGETPNENVNGNQSENQAQGLSGSEEEFCLTNSWGQ